MPLGDHFQTNLSGTSDNRTARTRSQMERNWTMTCTVRACVISATQRIPRGPVLRPSWIVHELLTCGETAAHKLGARCLTEQPASPLSS
jgi:hypothetical protein